MIEVIKPGGPSEIKDGFSVSASVCTAKLGLIDSDMSMTEVDRIGEPSRFTVKADFPGIESVCSDGASVDNVLASGRLVTDGSVAGLDPELANRNPPDCDALGSVASGASILLVLVEPKSVVCGISGMKEPNLGSPENLGSESSIWELGTKARGFDKLAVVPSGKSVPGLFDSCVKASGVTLLGSAESDTDWIVPSRSDNVGWGAFDAPGTVREIETLVFRKLDAKLLGSEATESESPTVIDFPGTVNWVEESKSNRFDSERSGFGTIEVNG